MTTAYDAWVRAGRPVDGVARPLAQLRDRLRVYGYVVYDIGNAAHLQHDPPEDHTPYSATGWPVVSPRWWIHAIDVMPPPAGRGLPSLLDLGQRIERDWPVWLKYMNRPTNLGATAAVHVSRQPNPASRSSSDVGHIHLSGRSDMTYSTAGDGYDPVARLRGQTSSSGGDDDVLFLVKRIGNPDIYLASGAGRAGPISPEQFERLSRAFQLREVDPVDFDLVTVGLAAPPPPAPSTVTVNVTEAQIEAALIGVIERVKLGVV